MGAAVVAVSKTTTPAKASTMAALVGQWGSRLYVSSRPAREACERIWGVPARHADIDFFFFADDDTAYSDNVDDYGPKTTKAPTTTTTTTSLRVTAAPRLAATSVSRGDGDGDDTDSRDHRHQQRRRERRQHREAIAVEGWGNARVPGVDADSPRYGRIPILWTPTAKALWLGGGGGGAVCAAVDERGAGTPHRRRSSRRFQ